MRIKILDEPVRQNVELFLDILRRVKQKQVTKSLPAEKVFKAWLNRNTGQLFFAEIREESLFIGKKEWRAISFSYHYDPVIGEIQFTIQDANVKAEAFNSQDIDPVAMRVLQDTMKIFSQISNQLKGPSDLDTKIAVLSKMSIETDVTHEDRNLLIDAWHHVDRLQAEQLLQGKPAGTYLFRKDDYAEILEEQLELELNKVLKCFTLTFSQDGGKVSDYTLVHVDGVWQVYNDDPALDQQRFSDLKELVSIFKNKLKYPLYH